MYVTRPLGQKTSFKFGLGLGVRVRRFRVRNRVRYDASGVRRVDGVGMSPNGHAPYIRVLIRYFN